MKYRPCLIGERWHFAPRSVDKITRDDATVLYSTVVMTTVLSDKKYPSTLKPHRHLIWTDNECASWIRASIRASRIPTRQLWSLYIRSALSSEKAETRFERAIIMSCCFVCAFLLLRASNILVPVVLKLLLARSAIDYRRSLPCVLFPIYDGLSLTT